MSQPTRGSLGSAFMLGRDSSDADDSSPGISTMSGITSPELRRTLADVKGQAQFLLYLADQIEESLDQLSSENDSCHGAFLCKVLGMYSSQLESKHQGLGDKIAETCQEIYVTVREVDSA
jgi:hypothetical protein